MAEADGGAFAAGRDGGEPAFACPPEHGGADDAEPAGDLVGRDESAPAGDAGDCSHVPCSLPSVIVWFAGSLPARPLTSSAWGANSRLGVAEVVELAGLDAGDEVGPLF